MFAIRMRGANRLARVHYRQLTIIDPTIKTILRPGRSIPHSRFVSTSPYAGEGSSLPPRSFLQRVTRFIAIGIVFTTLGFAMAAAPVIAAINGKAPTGAETLTMYTPATDEEREVEDFISNHSLTQEMRSKPEFREARPHLQIPPAYRDNNLTGGTLLGPGRIVVPPVIFSEEGGKSLVSISYLGQELCGHPGIVHGGLLATLLDEGLARCCFPALPQKIAVTANLNINYRAPAPAKSYIVLRATTTKVEGRKAWVEGRIETLVNEGEKPLVLAEATALFIVPRELGMITNIFPTT
ncbi:Thioesterase/thiol ester dehydrase-isomerase [Hypoxylon trugodes]|uniref:Thioesterase/thiol ester dehydrase-isomerase n=1 Tax=Hypoxylon trugodes TaxID=326681 RepID=UPI00219AE6FA|nr:Thioesterase/thiol ester dehydrase-isomerase [Hypoxylon trugodes]KAI1386927.1 Thioesterase/thiol ester dehydrase-isomerase [Hypoxylon trugodes]